MTLLYTTQKGLFKLDTSRWIWEKAEAKINLTLSVGGRRSDGYHEIDTVMHSVSLADRLGLRPAEGIHLSVTEGIAPEGQANLVWQAAKAFFETIGWAPAVELVLEKHIPSEAGLGGGSTDAAAVLRGLNRMTGAGLSAEALREMGKKLGADVPFCVTGGCARCLGIGDELHSLPPWEELPLVLCRPPFAVSTAEAYREIDRHPQRRRPTSHHMEQALLRSDRAALEDSLSNDFERSLFSAYPALREAAELLTAWGRPVQMTGSGSAFFLLTRTMEEAEQIASDIKKKSPRWFAAAACTTGGIHD